MTHRAAQPGRWDAVVIGAGVNGLAASALLAKSGRKVLLLERREDVGGLAAGDEFHPGYRAAGPVSGTAAFDPALVETLGLARHGLSQTPETAPTLLVQRDGPGLLLHRDARLAAVEIRRFSGGDAEQYAEYRALLGRVAPLLARLLREKPPNVAGGVRDLVPLMSHGLALHRLRRADRQELLRIGPMSVADWLDEWFETDLLKSALAAPAIEGAFMGPFSPGSNANLLRAAALAGPVVTGGASMLVNALVAAVEGAGVVVRTGAAVKTIRASGGRALGVTLADQEMIDADAVLATCDPKQTFLRLLPSRDVAPKLEQRLVSYRADGIVAQVNLALIAPLRFAGRPELEVERAWIGETMAEMERAFDAVKYGRCSERPILDVRVPSIADPSLAPDGHAVVSMLVGFAPHGIDGGWTDARRIALGDLVVETLAACAPDVLGSIVAREVLTPVDIESRYGTTGGHLHHGDHALDQILVRPCPECARYATPIEGLYLGGSGSHPGGGLTGTPGRLAAAAILH